ncbi:MAG: hypothetical protein BWZ10_03057 [candidate division BRC1 bacterium ADurb.BinA364]|nr:MAG: hypothetical protein BWZ10_03057 [candidate division BRC1 bacterium ADurb.BinA364]
MDIERFAQSGRTGQWFAAWKNLAAYRESGCLRIARPLAGRRLTDSAVCQALRSQSLMDPLFETAVPLPVLGLGAELRDRGLTSIPLEQTCGELGAIQWRIGPMDSFPNGANKGRRHAATCALTLPPSVEVPPCIRLARAEDGIERGGKKILVLQYLAQAGVPRYWREAIPLVSQGSEMVWAPGLESADEAKAIASAPGERMIALEIAWRDAAQ